LYYTDELAAKTKAALSCSFNISYVTNVLIRRLADDALLSLIRNCLQLTVLEADCKDKALSNPASLRLSIDSRSITDGFLKELVVLGLAVTELPEG